MLEVHYGYKQKTYVKDGKALKEFICKLEGLDDYSKVKACKVEGFYSWYIKVPNGFTYRVM